MNIVCPVLVSDMLMENNFWKTDFWQLILETLIMVVSSGIQKEIPEIIAYFSTFYAYECVVLSYSCCWISELLPCLLQGLQIGVFCMYHCMEPNKSEKTHSGKKYV